MNEKGEKNERAYQELKAMLINDSLDKQRIYSIREISEIIKLGRAPVTDALKKLETEHFIKIYPQKGIMVREMTLQEMSEISDIRVAVEGFVVSKLAGKITPKIIAQLKAMLEEQKIALENNDPDSFVVADEKFHVFLSKSLGNSYIYELIQNMRERFFQAGLKLLKLPNRMKTTLEEHRLIVNALEAGNGVQAARMMVNHIESGRHHIGLLL